MVRECTSEDIPVIYEIINDAARAYRGVIPHDRYHEPYMPLDELEQEISDGVIFSGWWKEGNLVGIMGVQDRREVDLIRHAYVRTALRRHGIGSALLSHLLQSRTKPVLIGTWATADWAIEFYKKRGFLLVSEEQKNMLLRRYWRIPERQVETSVVLAGPGWEDLDG